MRSSSSPPHPAATDPECRRGRSRKAPAFHVSVFKHMELPCGRDWAELPADAISCILHRLDQVELLIGGVAAVCRSWRRAAREEPELWRRIDLRDLPYIPPFQPEASLANIMSAALRLSAGQCHTFFGEILHDDHFLLLAEQAPLLKSLHLIKCHNISNQGFANAIKRFHMLDELELLWCLGHPQVLETIAGVCPGLRHFRLVNNSWGFGPNDERKAHAIARMRELRSLHIVSDKIDNEGLTVILDNCHNLQYLNMHDCWNINMDDNLSEKCAHINMDDCEYLLPYDSYSCCSYPFSCFDDYHDLSLSYYLGDDIDDMDEEHGRIIDIKSMCRYLC
ncbi:F-box protein SKIP19-like [Lolium perenne]|uniref:F-box protein SKIP19-like n=1 Tax=Lolium perenne TaxID=4522 RepID=UPI0021F672C1|nr:F-box protein SKIP19-like [Lolium perenne]